jgi:hypothetical protein
MKKQNNIIESLEARTAALGGEFRVQRYKYIREAFVEMRFGDTNLTINIGPKGAIKYCSWFFIDASGQWSVHHDEKCFTGKRNGAEIGRFFNLMQRYAVKEAA